MKIKDEMIEKNITKDLKNHFSELNDILAVGDRVMNKFNKDKAIGNKNALPYKELEKMEAILMNALLLVGKLSSTRHEIQSNLKDYYTKTYSKSPAIGHKLYLKHYFGLLKPYDKVKNKLWKYLFIVQNYKDKNFK